MLNEQLKFQYNSGIPKYYRIKCKTKIIKVRSNVYVKNVIHTNLKNKAEYISKCMNHSIWELYPDNNLMDLKQIYRCKDNRFCPNCKKVDISKFIFKVKNILPELLNDYDAYMLTLTIPNCDGSELSDTLKYLSKCFQKLNLFFSQSNKKEHYLNFIGGFKVLEITYNKILNSYHPHYHCMVLIDKTVDKNLFNKVYKDRYSNKRAEYNYISFFEILLKQVWSLIFHGIRLSKSNLKFYNFSPGDDYILNTDMPWLEIDFRKLDDKGIYEIFKYTFKDIDVINFNVFKTLYFGLSGKRLRQGFGKLYNFKCEDLDEDIIDDIDNYLEKKEEPQEILVKSLKALINEYNNVTKISRFNSDYLN